MDELPWYRRTNYVQDIEGACPGNKWKNLKKPNFHTTDDIEGAQPRGRKIWITHDSMNTADIGAHSQTKCFKTKRKVNPLNPQYQLPSVEVAPVPEPRFVRDTMDVSDIDGTRPATRLGRRNPTDPLNISDIEGARRRSKSSNQCEERNSLDVSDIVHTKKKSQRQTCPLNPQYYMNHMPIRDEEKFSKMRKMRSVMRTPMFSLETGDIAGATAGSALEKANALFRGKRAHQKEPVPGAQADTVQRGLGGQRNPTNPLDPRYVYLDGNTTFRAQTAPGISRSASSSRLKESARGKASLAPLPSQREECYSRSGRSSVASGRLTHCMSTPMFPTQVTQTRGEESDASLAFALKPKMADPILLGSVNASKKGETPRPNTAAVPSSNPSVATRKNPGNNNFKMISNSSPTAKLRSLNQKERLRQDKMAVANLPDTLTTASCMFPNKPKKQ